METSVLAAANISAMALAVIFIVLIILIFTIKLLVKLIPYEVPPSSKTPRRQPAAVSAGGDHAAHVAVITATLARHLGKSPDKLRIVNISQP